MFLAEITCKRVRTYLPLMAKTGRVPSCTMALSHETRHGAHTWHHLFEQKILMSEFSKSENLKRSKRQCRGSPTANPGFLRTNPERSQVTIFKTDTTYVLRVLNQTDLHLTQGRIETRIVWSHNLGVKSLKTPTAERKIH